MCRLECRTRVNRIAEPSGPPSIPLRRASVLRGACPPGQERQKPAAMTQTLQQLLRPGARPSEQSLLNDRIENLRVLECVEAMAPSSSELERLACLSFSPHPARTLASENLIAWMSGRGGPSEAFESL